MALHQINGVRIRTNHDYPPIPVRSFDWSAVDDDTYDVDCDEDGFFSNCPVGHGATEQEAIDDLLEQIEEREIDAAQQSAESRERIMAQFDATIAAVKQWVEGTSC